MIKMLFICVLAFVVTPVARTHGLASFEKRVSKKVLDNGLTVLGVEWADFMERYRTGIEKVAQADVARVGQKYLHKDKLAILVIGKAADFDRTLSSFGPVTILSISIPEPGGKKQQ